MRSPVGSIKRFTLGSDFRSWKDLLRDQGHPWRTAIGTGLGVLVGSTPILGVHTWFAAGAGALLPVPRFSVLVGKHISNPLTLFPLIWIEIRIGQFLLGRPGGFSEGGLSLSAAGTYWLEAWVGFFVVGPVLALLTAVGIRVALHVNSVRGSSGSP
jgi:uncharacterized protein (DUF2062 family)